MKVYDPPVEMELCDEDASEVCDEEESGEDELRELEAMYGEIGQDWGCDCLYVIFDTPSQCDQLSSAA